jgi:DnaJ-class molecular chaperone
MDPLTATVAAGVGVLASVVYAGSCWLFPYRHCPRCRGDGKIRRTDSKVFRLCRKCQGTGRTLRVGRRLWNWWRRG